MNPDVKASSLPSLLIGPRDDPLSFIDLLSAFLKTKTTGEGDNFYLNNAVWIN